MFFFFLKKASQGIWFKLKGVQCDVDSVKPNKTTSTRFIYLFPCQCERDSDMELMGQTNTDDIA